MLRLWPVKCYAVALSSVARRSLRKPQLQLLMLLTLLAVLALFTTALQGSWQTSQWTATCPLCTRFSARTGDDGRSANYPEAPSTRVPIARAAENAVKARGTDRITKRIGGGEIGSG
ncbi:hypothetical protein FJT64_003570 [Amphibalanus amphitrite]|uniref:Uncharacterized protein n=1 Tax=Amphibalanus amphitrite TaxID=1232801 RepID=A0A6A4WAL8_AMPAM|nr:hypothetical protein FJT64_003570 [Amphibalanus amphitrite]